MNIGDRKQQFLRKAEVSILKTLRRSYSARFSELMRPTGLTSDTFKFYVRDLRKAGWIEKLQDGRYALTTRGKELANNIDESKQTLQKQPKLTMLLVVSRQRADGETEFLFQQRLRHPYFGKRGFLSGPVRWGEAIEQTALAELRKQTGLTGQAHVRSFMRVMDKNTENTLLEDKLFAVIEITEVEGRLSNTWPAGHNAWMTLADLHRYAQAFPLTSKAIDLLKSGKPYAMFTYQYPPAEY